MAFMWLSLMPLYEEQVLWRDIIERLERNGFILWSLLKGLLIRITEEAYKSMQFFEKNKISHD